MRTFHFIIALLLAAFTASPLTQAAGASGPSVHAILITATNQKAPADPKLAQYEGELQRNIPLSSFRYVAEGTAAVPNGGHAVLRLGRGHLLELDGEKSGGGIKLKVVWKNGAAVVFDTGLTLQSGGSVVLGRRPSDDDRETPIVLLIAR